MFWSIQSDDGTHTTITIIDLKCMCYWQPLSGAEIILVSALIVSSSSCCFVFLPLYFGLGVIRDIEHLFKRKKRLNNIYHPLIFRVVKGLLISVAHEKTNH